MEFLIELLVEILGEVFLENGVEMASGRRLPKWARVLILIASALFFTAVFGMVLAAGVGAFREVPLISLLLFALDAGLVFLCVNQIRRNLRFRSHQ